MEGGRALPSKAGYRLTAAGLIAASAAKAEGPWDTIGQLNEHPCLTRLN